MYLSLGDVEGLTVRNLQNFQHQHGALPWTFSPPPDVSGSIKLDSPYHWLTCRGSGPEAVTFDLGVPLLLERIELTGKPQRKIITRDSPLYGNER